MNSLNKVKCMKILLLTRKYLGSDGHSIVMNNIALSLIQKGIDVKIGAFNFVQDPPNEISKVEFSYLKDMLLFNKKMNEFDIIHNFQGLTNYLALFSKKPFIFHYLGAGTNLQIINLKFFKKFFKKYIKKYFVSSKVSSDQLCNIMDVHSEIIPLAVNPSFFNTNEKLELSNDKIILLTITRMIAYKKNEELLYGFKELLQKNSKVQLEIIGDGEQFLKIQNIIKKLDLSSKVKLIGRIPHSEIKEKYMNCDIYVSTSSKEAFPIPFLESMALSKPVVASNIPIHEEIIQESQGGEIFELGNKIDFVKKVSLVINNRKQYGEKGREYSKKWNYENLGKLLIPEYNKLLKK